jgi:hypothetical protein
MEPWHTIETAPAEEVVMTKIADGVNAPLTGWKMMLELSKAVSGERARIEELLARESARVRRAFRTFLDMMESEPVRRQVRLALERGGVEAAIAVMDSHIVTMSTVLGSVYQAASVAETASIARKLGATREGVAITFDPGSPRGASLMRDNRLQFVREFSGAQREATRAALTEAMRTGAGTREMARAFRDSIGLTQKQRLAVANYRRLLEAGDAQALQRVLRDRRFDPSVRRAVEEGEPLGPKRIQTMVDRYRARMIQMRAETIARTETLRMMGLAQREAMDQTLEQVNMPRTRVVRVWRATQDARTRDTHAEMDRQERGLDVPFDSPSGARLMYPGDPAAPAAEVINCRCVVVHEFRAGAAPR